MAGKVASIVVHRPLKKRLDLRVEELEQRIAPVTLTGGQTYQFTDANGDLLQASFLGRGSATILDSTLADPAGTDIGFIDLFNTDANSKLVIRDMVAGDGDDTIHGDSGAGAQGQISDMGVAAVGLIEFNAPTADNWEILISAALGRLVVRGAFTNSYVEIDNDLNTVLVQGRLDNTDFDSDGNVTQFTVGDGVTGMDNDSDVFISGRLGRAMIYGDMNNGSRIEPEGYAGRIEVFGSVLLNSEIDVDAGAGTIRVWGDLDDSDIYMDYGGRCNMIRVEGSLLNNARIDLETQWTGLVYVGGDMDGNSDIYLYESYVQRVDIAGNVLNDSDIRTGYWGSLGSLYIGGNVNNEVDIENDYGNVGSVTIIGDFIDSEMDFDRGNCGSIFIGGDMRSTGLITDIEMDNGLGNSIRIMGDVDNARIELNDCTVRQIYVGGDFFNGSDIDCYDGSVLDVRIMGDAYDGTGETYVLDFDKSTCNSLYLGGNMYDGAEIETDYSWLGKVRIGGRMDSDALMDLYSTSVGPIDVVGGMFDGSWIDLDDGDIDRLTIGGPLDSLGGGLVDIEIDDGSLGDLTVNGYVFGADVDIDIMHSTINIRGGVDTSDFEIDGGTLDRVFVGGDFINTEFDMLGGYVGAFIVQGNMVGNTSQHDFDGSVGAISIGGYVDDADFQIYGSTDSFTVGGYANDLDYDNSGACSRFRIGGGATDVHIQAQIFDSITVGGDSDDFDATSVDGPIGSVMIRGDWANGTLQTYCGFGSIAIQGTVTDSYVSTNGGIGRAFIGGDFIDSDFDHIYGEVGLCRIAGGVYTNSNLDFRRQVGMLSIGGPLANSTLGIDDGGARSIAIHGDVDASTIDVYGPTGRLFVAGGILNASTVNFRNGIGTLTTTGAVDASTITIRNGGDGLTPTTLRIGGALSGGSTIFTEGDAALVSFGGGIGGASTLTIEGYVNSVKISGNLDAGSAVVIGAAAVSGSGQTYYTGTLKSMSLAGLINGNIQVLGTLHAINSVGQAVPDLGPTAPPFNHSFAPTDAGGAATGGLVEAESLAPGAYVS
ncbi:MAG: hypothetical protein AB1696_04470 [Planctomycetota bacterium]